MVTHLWRTVGEKGAARVVVMLGPGWPAAAEVGGARREERRAQGWLSMRELWESKQALEVVVS